MNKVLLHICCGVCAAGAVQRLREEGFKVEGYYYNPNIQPKTEYDKRLNAVKKIAKEFNFRFYEGEYEENKWMREIRGLENELEGGKRCEVCYKMRLGKTYQFLKRKDFDFFTTTLTISPYKKAERINKIGKNIGTEKFLSKNLKKKDGFKTAMQIAKELNLYSQNYCGCIFSNQEPETSPSPTLRVGAEQSRSASNQKLRGRE